MIYAFNHFQYLIFSTKQTAERFGLNHIVHVIRGVEDEYVKSYSHNELKIFGTGSEQDNDFWRSVGRQTLIYQYLEKDIDNVGVLRLTEKGKEFLVKPHAVELAKDHDFTTAIDEEEESSDKAAVTAKAHDPKLFEILKVLRKQVARDRELPPYVIFQDPSLEEMATTYPTTKEELASVNGVGMGKVAGRWQVGVGLVVALTLAVLAPLDVTEAGVAVRVESEPSAATT